ncbi:hypothetical protein [Hyunsoonleella pacifica]|uniref:Beta-carotene 15,15'-monooxygenase n=1 Tax=Hyunsoonleella pacifica TaxID=1080224 RepID=A0A4Q9FP54_9FLAO|nr:hypothetical protein [Hyunsoonleella pacifica]TBN14439.1 hypothetical protein EYD46_12765 [Hyunsoonleella pacifica]GGD13761.1 hypothetical protein GCM10011368_14660 [Hyunsoonleella pacifica]
MNSYEVLRDKIRNAPELNFGDILNEAIELFKKVWLKGFLVILIIAIAGVCLNFIFQAIGLAVDPSILMEGITIDSLTKFYSQSALYGLPQTILASTLMIVMLAGFYRMCKQEVQGETYNDDYFYYFKKEYFSKALMLGIVYALIQALAQALLLIPYIYVFVPLSYFSIIFANNPDLSETEIIKLSFALGNKKWLISFGSMFVCGILGMLGAIACIVGVVLTVSIMYLPVFLIYKGVLGFDNRNEIDLIGTNQREDSF